MSELLLDLEEIPDGGTLRRELGSREIAIFRKGGDVYAIDAVCPHRGGPLDDADLENEFVAVCPWHGWRFDIRTGKSPTHPGHVNCYNVTVDNGKVMVRPRE